MSGQLVPSIIYGPLESRRFGLSLGINLSGPGKSCTFDCLYCFRGTNHDGGGDRTPTSAGPRAAEVLEALERWLDSSPTGGAVADWTFAGNAEPTMHPEFAVIVEKVIALRNRDCPKVKVTVLTNGTGLLPRLQHDHAAVQAALTLTDRPCLKLDAGTEAMFRRLSRPGAHVTLAEWMDAAEGMRPLMLQTMLVQGTADNTAPAEIEAIGAAYVRLQPRSVHLLTINKTPAVSVVQPAPPERLEEARKYFETTLAAASLRPEILVVT